MPSPRSHHHSRSIYNGCEVGVISRIPVASSLVFLKCMGALAAPSRAWTWYRGGLSWLEGTIPQELANKSARIIHWVVVAVDDAAVVFVQTEFLHVGDSQHKLRRELCLSWKFSNFFPRTFSRFNVIAHCTTHKYQLFVQSL